jgi:histidinol phosphatase-like PHP family hydrolase/ribosome-associated translation inhibitor RaiA
MYFYSGVVTLAYFTGSTSHNVRLPRIAQTAGLLLNEYGLFRKGAAIAGRTEAEIYRALRLSWVTPELREDRGEIEAAAAGQLPELHERGSLRGDLHIHSLYTDGRASIEDMARHARKNGLEYIAITDHSRRIAMVHGLDSDRLQEQRREIERIQKKLSGIVLFRGIEVDILDDGSLDLPDEVLSELDWVVASVHYKIEQDSTAMTRRIIKAVRNPNVDVIGHPSGRLLGHLEPSRFDLSEVLRVAREEGCALKVNYQPERLDLNDAACLAAKRAQVKVVVSSDAHSTRNLDLLNYGINQARRGWIEKNDVVNTLSLKNLRLRRYAGRLARIRIVGPAGQLARVVLRFDLLEEIMQRPLKITSRDFPLSDAVEAEISEKAAALDDYLERISGCEVTVQAPTVSHHRKGGPFFVGIRLTVPGRKLEVDHQAEGEMSQAIREAFDAARRQ